MNGDHELSENEVNNMIYLGLRYACGRHDPVNEDIEVILLLLGDDRSIDKIVEQTVDFARRKAGQTHMDFKTLGRIKAMRAQVEGFLKCSEPIRNDLGLDTEFFSKPTFH